MTVDDMLTRGEVERVEVDESGARRSLDEARSHIDSAAMIIDRDQNGAYQLAYDAARKTVVAHMRKFGLRVRRGEGGHVVTATSREMRSTSISVNG